MEIAVSEFKTKCFKLMDDVEKYHKEIVITKNGKPIAKLSAVEESPPTLFGYLKDSVVIIGDIVEPTGEKWNVNG